MQAACYSRVKDPCDKKMLSFSSPVLCVFKSFTLCQLTIPTEIKFYGLVLSQKGHFMVQLANSNF